MSKSAEKINRVSVELFLFVAIIFLLLLTSVNLQKFLLPKKVLGAETNVESETDYWQDFVNAHPSYIPGWIELGRLDKVNAIDPNYF